MARRLAPTLADYMAIAISPALIMGLVGSLAFFLLDLTYRGQHADRLQWILSWFVMAIVLIARIAIVEGGERASMFGVALGGVMMLAVLRFAPGFLLLTPFLLALIWWSAHELTWNCTWIDDDEDPGGEGLLQAAGLDREETTADPEAPAAGPVPAPGRQRSWWQRLSHGKRRRARAPGVTIVWFSLAALPVFGLGQLAIPVEDTGRRQYAFWLATIYVGSGLGLLLTTAFLGLRRYLRRRGLEMPTAISGGWLTLGGLMIAALLIAGALLPRPSAEYSLARVAVEAGKEALGASRWAALSGSAGEGEGAAGGEGEQTPNQTGDAEGQGEPGGKQGQSAASGQAKGQGSQGPSGDKGGQSQNSSQGKSGDQSHQGDKRSGNSQQQGQQGKQGQGQQGEGQKGQGSQDSQGEAGQKSDGAESKQAEGRKGDQGERQKSGDEGQKQAKGNDSQGKGQSEGRSRGGGSRSKQSQSSEPAAAAKPPAESPSSQPLSEMARQATNVLQDLGGIAQVLKWLLVAAAVAFFVWQFGPELLRMLQGLMAWLRGLFGGSTAEEADEAEMPSEEVLRRRSFSQFGDPFLSGVADRASPEQLVTYTFAALEAWGRELGIERSDDQTPLEFADRLAAKFAQLEPAAGQTAEFYTYLAYGPGRLTPQVRGPLESLWKLLRSEAAAARGETPNWQPASGKMAQ